MTQTKNKLALIAEEKGLEQSQVEKLLASFGGSFKDAQRLSVEAKTIVVTSEDQVKEMKSARNYRLALKTIRTKVEGTRKELKEQSLREGRAIDGIANVIKALVVPVEEHLEKQEKFIELKLEASVEKTYNERVAKLEQYVEDASIYKLREMIDKAFDTLLEAAKLAHEKKVAADKKVQEELVAQEKVKQVEQERVRLENIKLKKEAEKAEAKRVKEQEIQDAKLKKEREKRETIENKLKVKEDANKAIREQQKEAYRQALVAPDKEKLIKLASTLDNLEIPNVRSREAGEVIKSTLTVLAKVSEHIREKAKTL